MINRERLVSSFCEMVGIPSPSTKEAEFALNIKKRLQELGMEVLVDNNPVRQANLKTGNIIGRLPGSKKGVPPVLFVAHLDTVSPGKGITPVVENGLIKSGGDTILGADDKAGLAAILEAILHLGEEKIVHGEVEVLFTVAEETGLLGSRYLDTGLIRSKYGFVLDNGGAPGTIVNQGPAHDKIRAVFYGKAAHAGVDPEHGISAIQAAARAIDRMKLLRIDKETTANIGIISGGQATNIVCDRVEIEGEARSLCDAKLLEQGRHMVECLNAAARELGARVEIERERMYSAFYVKEDDPVVQMAVAAAKDAGFQPVVISTGGGSDTNYLNVHGIKTLNLGTGMNKVHSTEEEIKIEDLVGTAAYLVALVEKAAKAAF